jgi:hypothetical protein
MELKNSKNVGETHLAKWYIRIKKSFAEIARQQINKFEGRRTE